MKYIVALLAIGLAAAQGPFDFDGSEEGMTDNEPMFGGPAGGFGGRGKGGGKGGKGRGGHGHRFEPPFLRGQNETVKREFFQIMRKSNETIQEQKQEIQTWATKWSLLDQVQAFENNMTQFKQELSKNITDLIASLPQVQQSLEQILTDESQTRQQMWEAVRQLKNQSRQAVDVIFFIGTTFKHHRRPRGGQFGMGGPGMDGPQHFGQGGSMGGNGQMGRFGQMGGAGQMGGFGGQRGFGGGQRGFGGEGGQQGQNPFERNSIQRGF